MSVRDENLRILNALHYGVEEELGLRNNVFIHLYDPKNYYVDKFKNHEELADWISENIKGVK